jgi:hypothetical protein
MAATISDDQRRIQQAGFDVAREGQRQPLWGCSRRAMTLASRYEGGTPPKPSFSSVSSAMPAMP